MTEDDHRAAEQEYIPRNDIDLPVVDEDGEPVDDEDRREASLDRALAYPIPHDLHEAIAEEIEPHTMNMYLDHGDTMTCIEVAYPLIRAYLLGNAPLPPSDDGAER